MILYILLKPFPFVQAILDGFAKNPILALRRIQRGFPVLHARFIHIRELPASLEQPEKKCRTPYPYPIFCAGSLSVRVFAVIVDRVPCRHRIL
jgi:hypothetical protein